MASEGGMLKGSALREFLLWYEQHYGTEHRASDAAALPDHLRELVDPDKPAYGLLPSKWYPLELVHASVDQFLKRMGQAEMDEMAMRAGPEVVRSQMTGLQRRAFNLLMSPERYRKYVATIWRQNFDSGDIEVIALGPGEHHGFTRNWRGHHRVLCRVIHSGKQAIYEAMGCKNVTVKMTGCVGDGSDACSSLVRWTP
jgi:hypothetical protein